MYTEPGGGRGGCDFGGGEGVGVGGGGVSVRALHVSNAHFMLNGMFVSSHCIKKIDFITILNT